MFTWRVREVFEGGGEILRAQSELASRRFKRALVGSALVVLVVMAAAIGLGAVVAGITIEIADIRGWGQALMIVGGAVALLCAGGLLIAHAVRSSKRSAVERDIDRLTPEQQLREAKAKMSVATDMHARDPQAPPPSPDGAGPPTNIDELKTKAMRWMARHPVAIGGGSLLVIALVGPKRLFRYASKSAATVGLVSTMMDAIGNGKSDHGHRAAPSARPASAAEPETAPQRKRASARQAESRPPAGV